MPPGPGGGGAWIAFVTAGVVVDICSITHRNMILGPATTISSATPSYTIFLDCHVLYSTTIAKLGRGHSKHSKIETVIPRLNTHSHICVVLHVAAEQKQTPHIHMYIYIYIYICVCVCVVREQSRSEKYARPWG